MQTVSLPNALPALLARLHRVRSIDNDIVGTLSNSVFAGIWVLGVVKVLTLGIHTPPDVSDPLQPLRLALLGAMMLIAPFLLFVRIRRKRLNSSAELLEALEALKRQELTMAEAALKDLKSIASAASGHSAEARNHARELIRRVEAAKGQHGALPIPATVVEDFAGSLPVPDYSGG